MSLQKFFMEGALEYGIPGINVEIVKNTGSKRTTQETFKITDTITGREYFIRSGENGRGWATVKCERSQGVIQYGVLSLNGYISKLGLKSSVFVVERHIAKQRKKLQKSY
jgi:hypothetical protein